jgi:hypothetical protein
VVPPPESGVVVPYPVRGTWFHNRLPFEGTESYPDILDHNQWRIYNACLGWAITKDNWAALHCSITIVQTTVLNLVLSEISGWPMFHRAHPVDLTLAITDDPQYPGYKTPIGARAARP